MMCRSTVTGVEMRPRKVKVTMPRIGFNGSYQAGVLDVVDPDDTAKKVPVAVNVKHDALMLMFTRNDIDATQYMAGERFRELVEKAQVGGVRSSDLTREPVDGGSYGLDVSERASKAAKQLAVVHELLGHEDYMFLWRAVVMNAPDWLGLNWRRRRDRRTEMKLVLFKLAKHWGYC